MKDCCNHECKAQEEQCHEEENDCKTDFFLEVADCAWTEVLKDKIKEHILKTQNDKMTELAKIIAEANGAHWRNKMDKKKNCMEFEERLCQFFSHKK